LYLILKTLPLSYIGTQVVDLSDYTHVLDLFTIANDTLVRQSYFLARGKEGKEEIYLQ
jgi:hypothetical protein